MTLERALVLVQMGELSAARHALEGGNQQTLRALQDPDRRFAVPRSPLPLAILNQVPEVEFDLSQEWLLANLRSSRRGPGSRTLRHDSRSHQGDLDRTGLQIVLADVSGEWFA